MAIKCCNGCLPPKRTGDCHATCPDYIIEKAFHEAERQEELEKYKAKRRISDQRVDIIGKRVKHHGRKFMDKTHYKYG